MRFSRTNKTPKTTNLAGGKAYVQTSKTELATTILTSFLKDQFYRSANESIERIDAMISNEKDKKFVAKLAVYARNVYGMRSVSHLIASRIGKQVKGEQWTKTFFDKVVKRPDDAVEIVACYGHNYDFTIPNSMKKGLGDALSRMSSYQLTKYRCENREVKLVDVVNICHPKNTEALKALIKGELTNTGNTWEAELSAAGQEAESDDNLKDLKADAWKRLIEEGKLGYFALLRNLCNIANDAPDAVPAICSQLVNREAIKKSLVLPFRFIQASAAVSQRVEKASDKRLILQSIAKAIDLTLDNVPSFDGDTLVVLDDSGSMTSGEEGKTPADIGALFAAAIAKKNNSDLMRFSDQASYLEYNPDDTLSTITKTIRQRFISGGTNFHSIFECANKKYDRVIILSDMQGWMGGNQPTDTFNAWKKQYSADPKVYSFDLAGYGTLQFPENNVFLLAGFSDKTLDIMKLLEADKNALINEIEKIEL